MNWNFTCRTATRGSRRLLRGWAVRLSAAVLLLTAPGIAVAQFLVVPDSSADRIMTFDPFDGSLIDTEFIVDAGGTPFDFGTPKDAIQVDKEIWVADQISDAIFRFGLDGSYLSTISGGLDNIRGMAFAQGTVYVSNAGTNNGAPGDALVTFDADGNFQGNILDVGDPFDVYEYGGELLISDIDNEDIRRHDFSGAFVGIFHDSDGETGIDFPQQLNSRGSNVMAAGFSPPAGLYEYDPAGNQVNYFDVGTGARGVYELGNGNLMFTDGSGVHVLDPNTGQVATVVSGSGQYINLIVPEPQALLLSIFGWAWLGFLRRVRA